MSTQPTSLGALTIPGMVDEYAKFFATQNGNATAIADENIRQWKADAALAPSQNRPLPPSPTMPMLITFDAAKGLQIALDWNQRIMNGEYGAQLDFTPAITKAPYAPISVNTPVLVAPTNPNNPIGPEEGIGSGVYNSLAGDTRKNADVFYRFGIPMRLHVTGTPVGVFVRFYVIDWSAPPPPTPTFTGDAPS